MEFKQSSDIVCKFKPEDCPVTSVCVFSDRAEVKRDFKFQPKHGCKTGYEVHLEGLSSLIPSTIRVNGGQDVVILHVSHKKSTIVKTRPKPKDKTETQKVLESQLIHLVARRKSLLESQHETQQALQRILTRKNLLNQYADTLVQPHACDASNKHNQSLTSLSKVQEYLAYYTDNLLQLSQESHELTKTQASIEADIQVVNSEMAQISANGGVSLSSIDPDSHTVVSCYNIIVNFELKSDPELPTPSHVDLQFVYQIDSAKWSASYDFRVDPTTSKVVLYYFGVVSQGTGEEWRNCELSLSTASPAHSGVPPEVKTKNAIFFKPKPIPTIDFAPCCLSEAGLVDDVVCQKKSKSVLPRAGRGRAMKRSRKEWKKMDDSENISAAKVINKSEMATNATFVLERKAIITGDNATRKVAVGILQLEAKFTHYSVPSQSRHCYLKAHSTNTSRYPLLASKSVSVFFDGNFVCNSSLEDVFPGEVFDTYLGVDASVKVDQQPLQKYSAQNGVFSKLSSERYVYLTRVHNTNQKPITIMLKQSIPESLAKTIVVAVTNPTPARLASGKATKEKADETEKAEEAKKARSLSEAKQSMADDQDDKEDLSHYEKPDYEHLDGAVIEWSYTLKPNQKLDIPLEYSITWPSNQKLSFD